MTGTVKWFNKEKGYGFIADDDGTEFFVHYTGIAGDGYRILKDGQRVTFGILEDDKGLAATNVTKIVEEDLENV